MKLTNMNIKKIALIGLGYVGLPLAVEFGKKRSVIGFDINRDRIDALQQGLDSTLETTKQELQDAVYLKYTTKLDDIKDCTIFIVTVPTPIDKHKRPDLTPLEMASNSIGRVLKMVILLFMNRLFIRVQQRKSASQSLNISQV